MIYAFYLLLVFFVYAYQTKETHPLFCWSEDKEMKCELEQAGNATLTFMPSGQSQSIRNFEETRIIARKEQDYLYKYKITLEGNKTLESELKIVPLESYANLRLIIHYNEVVFKVDTQPKEVEIRFVPYNMTEYRFTLNATHNKHVIPYPPETEFSWYFTNRNIRNGMTSDESRIKVNKTLKSPEKEWNEMVEFFKGFYLSGCTLGTLNILLIGPFRVGKTLYASGVTSVLAEVFNEGLIVCNFDHNCTQSPDDIHLPVFNRVSFVDFPGYEGKDLDLYIRMAHKIMDGYRFPREKNHTTVLECMKTAQNDDSCFLPKESHLKINAILYFVDFTAPDEFPIMLYKKITKNEFNLPTKVIVSKMQLTFKEGQFESYANFRQNEKITKGINFLYEKFDRAINEKEMYPIPAIMGQDDFKKRDLFMKVELLRPIYELAQSLSKHKAECNRPTSVVGFATILYRIYFWETISTAMALIAPLLWIMYRKLTRRRTETIHTGPENGSRQIPNGDRNPANVNNIGEIPAHKVPTQGNNSEQSQNNEGSD